MDGPAIRYEGSTDRRLGSGHRRAVLLALVLLVSGVAQGTAVAEETAGAPGSRHHVWLDVNGHPLPFQRDAEILEFLRTARVVGSEELTAGINRADRLLLEKDGIRARAIFRDVDIEKREVQVGTRYYFRFLDSCAHECAAYALARWLGLDCVPPVVPRRFQGRRGSVQIWIENVRDQTAADFDPPSLLAWVSQIWDADLFDNLILNVDRNTGNILAGRHYRLWLIDHTRAFQPVPELLAPERLAKVNRRVWNRLQETDEEDLEEVLGDYLDGGQLDALMKRRELLIERVERLVAERGEEVVFY
jgi:hypothetical protein